MLQALLAHRAHPDHDAGAASAHDLPNLLKGVLTPESQPDGLQPLHLPLAATLPQPLLHFLCQFWQLQSKSFSHADF